MNSERIPNHTRCVGLDQGYKPLHIRDEDLGGIPCMVTRWRPSDDEIACLLAGGYVHLRILGEVHPPVSLECENAKL
jgi:hypothetical protein